MRVAITGATGLIGRALTESLASDGHAVHRLTRTPSRPGDVAFDPAHRLLDPAALRGTDAVVHLAGEPIAQRWNADVRRRIRESRVQGTRLIAETVASLEEQPPVLVSGSAVGYYGSRGDEVLTEQSAPGDDFLSEVTVAWEGAAEAARDAGVRVVHPRMGVVLSANGGALERMLLPFRLGLGGRVGDGRQWLSWISLADTVRALRHMIDSPDVQGPVNVVGPAPVDNAMFTEALGRALNRPTLIPIPKFALRAVFTEMADATLMASQRAIPEVLLGAGFRFEHADIDAALRAALRTSG
ncbi:MAG: TIGR01777 family protein [Gemmatimonadaceae bacterium]|nr:TIGR01777 family protein [Gemmatimonadaceae bacterium]